MPRVEKNMWSDENLRQAFERERDIPYRIPLDVNEVNNCCSGKNLRLKQVFEERGYTVRQRICWFDWSSISMPKEVVELLHQEKSSHLYLEVLHRGDWHVIDASWDKGLKDILPVNDWGKEMKVAVECDEVLSPEESSEYMHSLTQLDAERDIEVYQEFYRGLNEWLEETRSH